MNCFKEWRAWLLETNTSVIVFLDHANLISFMTAQNLTARQARWASMLSEFNFEILHISGKSDPADPALRRSHYSEGKVTSDKVVLLGHREDLKNDKDEICINDICLKNSNILTRFDPSIAFMPPDNDTLNTLQSLYATDPLLTNKQLSFLTNRDCIWWWRDRVYVPFAMCHLILQQYHDAPLAGD